MTAYVSLQIAHLALIGGSSVQDVTRSVMKRCMLDALAKNYCMTGRKGKLRMEHLQLVCVVTGNGAFITPL